MNSEKVNQSLRIKVLLFILTVAAIVTMFPSGESIESEIYEGSIWTKDDLIASKSFQVLKAPEEYNAEREKAAESVLPIFVKDNQIESTVKDSINSYNKFLREQFDYIFKEGDIYPNSTFLSEESYSQFLKITGFEKSLIKNSSVTSLSQLFKNIDKLTTLIYKRGVINKKHKELKKDSIAVRDGKYESYHSHSKFLDLDELKLYVENYFRKGVLRNSELNDAATEYLLHFIKPNLIFSQSLTDLARKTAMENVSKGDDIVKENERIVGKHDYITKEILQRINSYRIAKADDTSLTEQILQQIGFILHVASIFVILIIYIYLFRKKIYSNNLLLLLISIILTFVAFQAFFINQIQVQAPIYLLILIPSVSILFTIIFDSRIGFYGTIVISLIVGALRGNDYAFVVMNIFAGSLAAFTVRDIKNRNQIFRSFLFILLGYAISIIAFGFEQYKGYQQLLIAIAFAASNALLSPVISYGLIIFFEKFFKITTDLTLLELTDFNSPLLKNLAKVTPGTFTHSITIGSMVETAAESIGANPILARVGAYYHDIGKTVDPEAFVENQLNNENLHNTLKSKDSAKLIIEHVEKGLQLADKYHLPEMVKDFIPMHHGTLVVKFFYEKYKEEFGEENVNIEDFRYPGPKPNTKETSLVMLADACESIIRSMDDLDEQKIRNVINNLFKQRLDDGQLDDSPLTFHDINIIKEVFHTTLVGQHHRRIRYPKQDELESENKEQDEE